MDINEKFRTSKKLIFIAWVIVVTWDSFLQVLQHFDLFNYDPQNIPFRVAIVFIFAGMLMLFGLWLGSRGIGIPLSVRVFLSLLFGYPCWIPVSILFVMKFVIPFIYFEFVL
jgi:hypothetical protein